MKIFGEGIIEPITDRNTRCSRSFNTHSVMSFTTIVYHLEQCVDRVILEKKLEEYYLVKQDKLYENIAYSIND